MSKAYKQYSVTINGITPLLLHKHNIKWDERVKVWTKDPANKGISIPGDCRTPAWTWIGGCYFADDLLVIESDNLMSMLRDAGKKCAASKGRGTLKAATQSGIIVDQIGWPIVSSKGTVSKKDIMSLKDETSFTDHEEIAAELGFELFVKPAKIGTQKHIRVRPRFDKWSVAGSITVLDETLTKDVIATLFVQAGRFVGLCDWRPGSPTPGHFGMFESEIKEIK